MKKLPPSVIENLATQHRSKVGISPSEPVNIKSLLRKLNILTTFKPLSDNFYGICVKSTTKDHFMLINSNTTRGRQHFTIAHEFYHLFFEENPTSHICSEGSNNPSEINANAFASAFLMPKEGLVQVISTAEITTGKINIATILKLEQYFSVSRISLLYRLKNLKYISNENFSELQSISVKNSAMQYGYDTSLYSKGNENLVIGDYGEKARILFEKGIISEGHYTELLNLIINEED